MFKTLTRAALFAVTGSSFAASAHAEIEDDAFDLEQRLNLDR